MIRPTPALLLAILVAIAGLALLVRTLESRMAFYPIRGVQETPAALNLPFTDVNIPTPDGETLHGWWLENPSPRAEVVFFHGNGGNLSLWLGLIADMRRRGLSVLAVDYRGYGASTGRPSEQGLYRDAEASVRWFAERLSRKSSPIVYWGRSLGSPAAAHAATRLAPDALVLETPMPDVRSLLRTNPVMWLLSFLSSYRFSTSNLVRQIDVPLLVVHGNADSIVPYSAGKRVFADARSARKVFATMPGADHNDLDAVNPALYWRVVDDFLASVRQAAR